MVDWINHGIIWDKIIPYPMILSHIWLIAMGNECSWDNMVGFKT
jgi:hypothetical protein